MKCKVTKYGTSPAQAIITSWHRCVQGRRERLPKVKSSTPRLSRTEHPGSLTFLFVQGFKSHGSMSQFPDLSGQGYNWTIVTVKCLVSLHAAFLFPTVCVVAWALQANLTIQEQFQFPTSQCVEMILPPLIPMLSALKYSSFKTDSFPFLGREYCRGGGSVHCCSWEGRNTGSTS